MTENNGKAQRVRVTMIPEGQQLFADGVEIKVGDTFGAEQTIVGKWTAVFAEGQQPPPPKAYHFALVDEVAAPLREAGEVSE